MIVRYELGRKRKDGLTQVRIYIAQGLDRKRIPTEIYLTPSDYSVTKKGVKIKNVNKSIMVNNIVNDVRLSISECAGEIFAKKLTTHDLVEVIRNKKNCVDFFAFADSWIQSATIKGVKNYKSAVNSFKAFVGRNSLPFDIIKPELLNRYINSLGDKPRAKSEYIASLRHLWKEAVKEYGDKIPRSPFSKIAIPKQKRVGQRATDIDTIKRIYNYSGVGRAQLARDCFILSFCLMGMNSADLYNVTQYKKNVISYDRTKTKNRRDDNAHMEIDVPPVIENIIKRYRSTGTYVFNFHKRYADMAGFNRALNIGLKEILGKDTKVTFYSARHSWATIARNELGIDKSTINEALVHIDRNMDVTDLYIMKDYKLVNQANKKVVDYVFC